MIQKNTPIWILIFNVEIWDGSHKNVAKETSQMRHF